MLLLYVDKISMKISSGDKYLIIARHTRGRFFATRHCIKCMYSIMQPRLPSRFDFAYYPEWCIAFLQCERIRGLAPLRRAAPRLRRPQNTTECAHTSTRPVCPWIREYGRGQKRAARPADYSSAAVARRAPTGAAAPSSNSRSFKHRVHVSGHTSVYMCPCLIPRRYRPRTSRNTYPVHERIKKEDVYPNRA